MRLNYLEFKEFFEKHKTKFMLSAAFVLVFFAGFGTGRYEKTPAREMKSFTDYSTKTAAKPKAQADAPGNGEGDTAVINQVQAGNQAAILGTTTPATQVCKIKGNISSKNKIYHVPGGAFYKTVSPEMCFNTEAEAVAAGFRKSGR